MSDSSVWHLLGLREYMEGHAAKAIDCFARAISIEPARAEFHNDLAVAYGSLERYDDALASLRRAIELDPEYFEALKNLGDLLRHRSALDEALACYSRALALDSEDAELHYVVGDACYKLSRLDEAYASFLRAIDRDPQLANAYTYLGTISKFKSDPAAAIAFYERALAIAPTNTLRYLSATVLPIICSSTEEKYYYRNRLIAGIKELLSQGFRLDPLVEDMPVTFFLAYQGENDREVYELLGELCAGASRYLTSSHGPRVPGSRIRIGFVSSHLNDHSVGVFWRGLIANLDRARFHVHVFSLSPQQDYVTEFLKNACECYVQLPGALPAAREHIATERMDLLFYPDIGMDPAVYALASSRLAPVQCTSWGHPVTSGLRTIDYYISSDLLESSGAEQHYTEELVRLKTLGIYIYRPPLPKFTRTRADFGLAADSHIYGCLQSLFKLHPEFDDILAGILRSDPEGIIVLPGGHVPHWDTLLVRRLSRVIPDVTARVKIIPRLSYDDYMQLTSMVDVSLLPPDFGGGRTSYEAFTVGTPVVTLPSGFLRGRITYALYQILGIRDCIASSGSEYIDIAVRLGADKDHRSRVRAAIRDRSTRLFEDISAVREMEGFLEGAVDKARSTHSRRAVDSRSLS
jgi:predicted O-linked N-acetylglucosamine transferase (SPINDLY family)